MCGIVGYIGNKKASEILINGLTRLEYRGYDSAGMSTIENGKVSNLKTVGRVCNLVELEKNNVLNGTTGIAHTRWATHGKPSTKNAHPHLDNSEVFSVVHNGIIENYKELREFLADNGYVFYSETDTEVIPNLIDYYYQKEKSVLKGIQLACNKMKGSFAIEVLSSYEPNKIFIVRKDSPLVIGAGNGEVYICSDIPAILSYTKYFYILNDYEYAQIEKDNVKFYDKDLNPIQKETKVIEWDVSAAEKDGYDDFMLKEIYEQPRSIRETIGSRVTPDGCTNLDSINFSKEYISSLNKIYIIACGTAMHAGLVGKNLIENLCSIRSGS